MRLMKRLPTHALWLALLCLLCLRPALAGPPFMTDDPEPVPFQHWEYYLSTIGTAGQGQFLYTGPHMEVNYGAAPGLQLHVLAPVLTWAGGSPPQPTQVGYGDTELGFKLRFFNDEKSHFEVGTFPLFELPTGNARRGLGSGFTQIFVPLWLQKTSAKGHWTSYGGSGWWRNPGPGHRNWNYTGWELQRNTNFGFIGGEVYHSTASTIGGRASAGFQIGGQLDFSQLQHFIFAVGHTVSGDPTTTWYAGYYLTIGRHPVNQVLPQILHGITHG